MPLSERLSRCSYGGPRYGLAKALTPAAESKRRQAKLRKAAQDAQDYLDQLKENEQFQSSVAGAVTGAHSSPAMSLSPSPHKTAAV
jgi:hypothetical protein